MFEDLADEILDARSLTCPLPVLRAAKAMKILPSGGKLAIMANDPASVQDFQSFCAQTGYRLLQTGKTDETFHYLIGKN